jgi:hypothetical protein
LQVQETVYILPNYNVGIDISIRNLSIVSLIRFLNIVILYPDSSLAKDGEEADSVKYVQDIAKLL